MYGELRSFILQDVIRSPAGILLAHASYAELQLKNGIIL